MLGYRCLTLKLVLGYILPYSIGFCHAKNIYGLALCSLSLEAYAVVLLLHFLFFVDVVS